MAIKMAGTSEIWKMKNGNNGNNGNKFKNGNKNGNDFDNTFEIFT